jgi:hypothetical protein
VSRPVETRHYNILNQVSLIHDKAYKKIEMLPSKSTECNAYKEGNKILMESDVTALLFSLCFVLGRSRVQISDWKPTVMTEIFRGLNTEIHEHYLLGYNAV